MGSKMVPDRTLKTERHWVPSIRLSIRLGGGKCRVYA
jgi:hypothetical protein